MHPSIRKAAFAGKFYPSNKQELENQFAQLVKAESQHLQQLSPEDTIIGGIVPHAGYIYSGYQAVHFFEMLKQARQAIETVVIINPNHTGYGFGNCNVCSFDEWETPLGTVQVDTEFRGLLQLEASNEAHLFEHSGEVQLPMLLHFMPHLFKVVMITMNVQDLETARQIAQAIHSATQTANRKVVVIASSDFSHFETAAEGYRKDQFVVDEILKMNSEEIFKQVKKHGVTTCGYGPVMALIEYAKIIAKNPAIQMLKRGHSGEVHQMTEVVDYISFLISH